MYVLRMAFYYNPFSMYNQPAKVLFQNDETDQLLAFNNAAKLRTCYSEMYQSLLMMGAICLILSSPLYEQTHTLKWLKKW